MAESVKVPQPAGTKTTGAENAEHGFTASPALGQEYAVRPRRFHRSAVGRQAGPLEHSRPQLPRSAPQPRRGRGHRPHRLGQHRRANEGPARHSGRSPQRCRRADRPCRSSQPARSRPMTPSISACTPSKPRSRPCARSMTKSMPPTRPRPTSSMSSSRSWSSRRGSSAPRPAPRRTDLRNRPL